MYTSLAIQHSFCHSNHLHELNTEPCIWQCDRKIGEENLLISQRCCQISSKLSAGNGTLFTMLAHEHTTHSLLATPCVITQSRGQVHRFTMQCLGGLQSCIEGKMLKVYVLSNPHRLPKDYPAWSSSKIIGIQYVVLLTLDQHQVYGRAQRMSASVSPGDSLECCKERIQQRQLAGTARCSDCGDMLTLRDLQEWQTSAWL